TPSGGRELPARGRLFGVATLIGVVSGLLGAGGAFITVPYLGHHNVKIHNAVATAAALGLPIALAATTGYIVAGLRMPDLPPWSAGYVHLPAMLAIVVASMSAAPFGATVAHRW